MTDLFWFFLPNEALPFVVLAIGLGMILGVIRPRRGIALIVTVVIWLIAAPFVEAIFAGLPWWVSWSVLLLVGLWLVRRVLESLLGREAAGHVIGHAFIAVIRGIFRVAFLSFRLLGRLFRWILRASERSPRRLLVLALAVAPLLSCEGAGRSALRGAERGAARSMRADMERLLKRDAERDARLSAKPLTRARTAYRYTTRKQAERESRQGLRSGTHVTADGAAGRPLNASHAQKRYGLPGSPEVRETIKLPRGVRVKSGKVMGGAPGVGELTAAQHTPFSGIRRIVKVKP